MSFRSLESIPFQILPKCVLLSIMRKALAQTNKLGVGEIAFSGREHLVAIGAPLDPKQKGLMLYTLRYEEELRDSKSTLSSVKESLCGCG
jgi:DNA end-binding protein Ku